MRKKKNQKTNEKNQTNKVSTYTIYQTCQHEKSHSCDLLMICKMSWSQVDYATGHTKKQNKFVFLLNITHTIAEAPTLCILHKHCWDKMIGIRPKKNLQWWFTISSAI